MWIMQLLSQSVTTVAIPIISPSLAMRKSARKLGNHGQGHGTLREEEVVKAMEAVEVEVAAEVVQVVGLVLKGSMLLGTVQQRVATLEWWGSMGLGKCFAIRVVVGMSLTQQSTMMSISDQLPLSRCHHTIHIGFFWENLTPLPPLLLEY
jgi:hypothetical protein